MEEIEIYIHERISERHPEITDEDVQSAFANIIRYRRRPTGEFIGVGTDSNSRLLEVVYIENLLEKSVLIYHAQTPPTKRTNKELGFENEKGAKNG